MGSVSTYTVKPLLPTVLGDRAVYEVGDLDLLYPGTVETVHVVPGPIDIAQFRVALALTLSAFPLHAGRLRRPGSANEKWTVCLTNDGVHVTVLDSTDVEAVPMDTIIQRPLPLAPALNPTGLPLDEMPLLKVQITRFVKNGSTAIGLSSSHMVGDGYLCLAFIKFLSDAYLGPGPECPVYYGDIPDISHTLSIDPNALINVPFVSHPSFPIGVPPVHLDRARAPPSVRVTVRFSKEQLEDIRRKLLTENASDGPSPRISLQDCLVALLASVYTRAEPASPPIQRIANWVNYRGTHTMPSNAPGNALMQIITEPVDFASGTMLDVAKAVRASIQLSRDPRFVAANIPNQARKFREAADRRETPDFLNAGPGCILVNSTRPFDWTSANFGYPGRTRFFHTMAIPQRFVKIFTPNPTLLADGSWKDNTGGAEVVLHVKRDTEEAFHQALLAEAIKAGVRGSLEYHTTPA